MLPHTYRSIYRRAHKHISLSKNNEPQPYHLPYYWKPWLTRRVADVHLRVMFRLIDKSFFLLDVNGTNYCTMDSLF